MNRVKLSKKTVTKQYELAAYRDREAAVLRRLSQTPFSHLVPRVAHTFTRSNVKAPTERYCLTMSRLPGVPLSESAVDEHLVVQLASIIASCHSLAMYAACGPFNSHGNLAPGSLEFGDCVASKLRLWKTRLLKYTARYDRGLVKLALLTARNREKFNRFSSAVFCHNDVHFGNVLSHQGRISGLIDWEHAGAYPVAWEMRKLYPLLYWDNPGLGKMFQERYSESHPGTAFPTNYEQVLMVATDCIGWLPWAFHNHLGEEIVRIDELFTRCMKMLSEGANNG